MSAIDNMLLNWLMQCYYINQETVCYMAHLLQIQIANLNWVPTLHPTHVWNHSALVRYTTAARLSKCMFCHLQQHLQLLMPHCHDSILLETAEQRDQENQSCSTLSLSVWLLSHLLLLRSSLNINVIYKVLSVNYVFLSFKSIICHQVLCIKHG
jgi:hypothetical protein